MRPLSSPFPTAAVALDGVRLTRALASFFAGKEREEPALNTLDKVTWSRSDAAVPAGTVGIVQGYTPDGRVEVQWLSGCTRAHAPAELTRRVDIAFEGSIVAGKNGDRGTFCTGSFPGKEAFLWEQLVAMADGEGLSTACVFLIQGDPRNGAHSVSPECPGGRCFCDVLYGEEKPWGCAVRAYPLS